jgi:hypothetical protein
MPLPESAYNLLTGNKWLLIIPYQQLLPDSDISELSLNLTNFSLPELTIESTEFNAQGRAIPIPTGIRNESKSIIFNYMLSNDWHQYKLLLKWFNLVSNKETNALGAKLPNMSLTISVYMLSEYKNSRFRIDFKGAWLAGLDAIDLNYQQGEEEIQHGFTINYAFYDFVDLLDE